jgi:hypothetical protein
MRYRSRSGREYLARFVRGGVPGSCQGNNNHMRHSLRLPSAVLALAAAAAAQNVDFLVTYSQPEQTLSGSGGTVLAQIRPNEVAQLAWFGGPCPVSAEKWGPRTVYDTMAGDENADGTLFNPTLFGSIDALVATFLPAGAGLDNQRTVFWSPSAAMGTNVSGAPSLRPGDVGRIVRNGGGDGQVEYFMRREQFNQALGLPVATPIDVDAIAFSPQFGVFFSLDQDVVANTVCGPVTILDGAVIGIAQSSLTYTADLRIAAVLPGSAIQVYTEAQITAMVVNAQVTNRSGACVTTAVDLEALDISFAGVVVPASGCTAQPPIFVPNLLFTTETMTGASVLETAGGGQIHVGLCSPLGRSCGFGPTLGVQMGIQPTSGVLGAPSYVNALCSVRSGRYVLEPRNHVLTVFPAGAPPASTLIDVGSPFLFNFVFLELVSPFVPMSLPGFPFPQFFPDVYIPSLAYYLMAPAAGGFGTFPMPGIPPFFAGKVLFQSVALTTAGTFELSTPAVIDVQ